MLVNHHISLEHCHTCHSQELCHMLKGQGHKRSKGLCMCLITVPNFCVSRKCNFVNFPLDLNLNFIESYRTIGRCVMHVTGVLCLKVKVTLKWWKTLDVNYIVVVIIYLLSIGFLTSHSCRASRQGCHAQLSGAGFRVHTSEPKAHLWGHRQ